MKTSWTLYRKDRTKRTKRYYLVSYIVNLQNRQEQLMPKASTLISDESLEDCHLQNW